MRSEETAKDINENHRNSRYLGNEVELSDTLRATTDFAEAADRADVIVMGVPSHGFRNVLTELAKAAAAVGAGGVAGQGSRTGHQHSG